MEKAKRNANVPVDGPSEELNSLLLKSNQKRCSAPGEELKQLENEIKKAYMLKTLRAQLAEQEASRLFTAIQAKVEDEIQNIRTAEELEKLNLTSISHRQRLLHLKAELKCQINEKQKKQNTIKLEERFERQLLIKADQVRIDRERLKRLFAKEISAEQQLLENILQREIQEVGRRKLEELENESLSKARKYEAELDKRNQNFQKLRFDAQKNREKITQSVAKLLLESQSKIEKRRRVLTDLFALEIKFDAEVEARELELRRRSKMRELANDLKEQMQFKEECKKRFLQREKEFAQTILNKIMESAKIEQLSLETRKRRQMEYRRELEHLMQERERIRHEELSKSRIALYEESLREEELLEKEREARMQLLQKHIDNVADYISEKFLYDDERQVIIKSRKNKK